MSERNKSFCAARRHRRKKIQLHFFALRDPARNVLREQNSQLSGSRTLGSIYALTTLGTCNYPRQFYDLGATRGREGRSRREQTRFRFNDFRRIKLYYRASPTHRDAPIPRNLLVKRHIVSYTFQLMGHSLI